MTFYNKFIYIITIGKIKVKCNQTGKVFNVVLSSLSKESGEQLTRNDLNLGTDVLYESSNGKAYDVTIFGLGQGMYQVHNIYCVWFNFVILYMSIDR